jgi:hypothetical protein
MSKYFFDESKLVWGTGYYTIAVKTYIIHTFCGVCFIERLLLISCWQYFRGEPPFRGDPPVK